MLVNEITEKSLSRLLVLFAFINAQKMKFSIKDFFSKFQQISRKLRIWSHLLKKVLMENLNFCAVMLFYRLHERQTAVEKEFGTRLEMARPRSNSEI